MREYGNISHVLVCIRELQSAPDLGAAAVTPARKSGRGHHTDDLSLRSA
ncbi:MAG TPA: hypothetical protein PKY89_06565 [Deltaproteobacteria bacterium]|nr:hypothetical protein [Deltaproteobacteria bacterium]HPJ93559.1 hypothetical protein [Deltaproteobacteria bacterium]